MDKSSELTISSWFSRGWNTYKANLGVLIGANLILAISTTVLLFVPWGHLVNNLVIVPPLTVGICSLYLKAIRGEQPDISTLFAGFSHFGKAWLTYFACALITIGGMFLLVIPGIIWLVKYNLSLFAVLDGSLSARKAIRLSGKITYGYKGKLFIGGLIYLLIICLYAMPFLWGLFLREQGSDKGNIFLAVGIVPYLVGSALISPWLGTSWASAYDSLIARWQQSSMRTQEMQESGTPKLWWKLWAPVIVGCVVAIVLFFRSCNPVTGVIPGAQMPREILSKIQTLGFLEENEKIKFFYSDASFDIEEKFYLFTDRKVVGYSQEYEQPAIIIPFQKIENIDADFSESPLLERTKIILTLSDNTLVWFPLPPVEGEDRRFYEALIATWSQAQENP